MIEVRIARRDLCEYSSNESAAAYVHGKLMAAGIPLKPFEGDSGQFFWDGPGILLCYDSFADNSTVYAWKEE